MLPDEKTAVVRLCYLSAEKRHTPEGEVGLLQADLARVSSYLEADRKCFEVRHTALEEELVESHNAINAADTTLSVFMSKLARFGTKGTDIDGKVKVALAQVESNSVLLTSAEKELADSKSDIVSTMMRMNVALVDERLAKKVLRGFLRGCCLRSIWL